MKRRVGLALVVFFLWSLHAVAGTEQPSLFDLEDAPTITVDWSKADTQAVTLHGNRSVVFANGRKGGRHTLVIKQDTTGGRTVIWPPSVHWPGGTGQPILTTTANKKDYLTFFYDGASYDALALAQNY